MSLFKKGIKEINLFIKLALIAVIKKIKNPSVLRLSWVMFPYLLIFVGFWLYAPPPALIILGALIWYDLNWSK